MSEFYGHPFIDPNVSHGYDAPPPGVFVNPQDYAVEQEWFDANEVLHRQMADQRRGLPGVREDDDASHGFSLEMFYEMPIGGEVSAFGAYPANWDHTLDHYATFVESGLSPSQKREIARNLARVDAEFTHARYGDLEDLLGELDEEDWDFIRDETADPDAWDGLLYEYED